MSASRKSSATGGNAQLAEHGETVGAGHAQVGDDDCEVVPSIAASAVAPSTAVSTA